MDIKELITKHASELKTRRKNAHKSNYGNLLILAGSPGMAGAAYFAGLAAFRCGMGMVKYVGPEENRVILQVLLPEAMYEADDDKLIKSLEWADYMVLGPGLSLSERAKCLVSRLFDDRLAPLLADKKLVVIDADALNIISALGLNLPHLTGSIRKIRAEKGLSGETVAVTPHVMEMLRLIEAANRAGGEKSGVLTAFKNAADIKRDPETAAEVFHALTGAITVLKDAETVVSTGNGVMRINSGCGAMAKAGSGDVLCGFIAGTCAVLGGNAADAVPLAVHLHGTAGCLAAAKSGDHGILAREIADQAGAAFCRILDTALA